MPTTEDQVRLNGASTASLERAVCRSTSTTGHDSTRSMRLARRFADTSVPLHRLQRIVGHTDPQITQRNLHPDMARLTEYGKPLSRFLPAPTPSDQAISSHDTHCCNLFKRPKRAHHGLWRSLVAHLTGGQVVAGSNPVSPTPKNPFRPASEGVFCHSTIRSLGTILGPSGPSLVKCCPCRASSSGICGPLFGITRNRDNSSPSFCNA